MKCEEPSDWRGPYGPYSESRTYSIIYSIPDDSDPLDVGGISGALRALEGNPREYTIYSSAVRGKLPGRSTPQGIVVHVPAGFVLEFTGSFGKACDIQVTPVI